MPGCATRPLTNGVATCTLTYTAVGTHSIKARYAGDDTYARSTSSVAIEHRVTAAALEHLTLSPARATVPIGTAQRFSAKGFDRYGNPLGTVTARTTFSISGPGRCRANSCSSSALGFHTVTGRDGSASGTARLRVAPRRHRSPGHKHKH